MIALLILLFAVGCCLAFIGLCVVGLCVVGLCVVGEAPAVLRRIRAALADDPIGDFQHIDIERLQALYGIPQGSDQ